jgi:eukaryotic-like serine/threonine-protein kinase
MTTTSLQRIGRYEIVGELGRGAMGVVYKAKDPTIGRTVALKTMRLDVHGLDSEDLLRRFKNEARAAGLLNHPNIVTIYDAGEDQSVFYIAMEYLEGTTLQEVLAERGVLEAGEAIQFSREICKGLDYAQAHGIVHRDIKPANIMITRRGAVKIMDFGIAKAGGSMTSTGQVLGTPNYMSPEQVKGKQLDGRSDLFSFAVMLYEMLTGEKPFSGQNITAIIYKIVNETPIPPRELDPTMHASLSAIVMKALAKAPEERYQSGAELVHDLESYKRAGSMLPTAAFDASAAVADKTDALPRTKAVETRQNRVVPAPQSQPEKPAHQPAKTGRKGHHGALIGALVVGLVLGLLAAGYAYRRSRAEIEPVRDEAQAGKPELQPVVPPISAAAGAPAPASPDGHDAAATPPAANTPAEEKPELKPRRATAVPVRQGEMTIASQPAGAKVSIDGQNDLNWVTPFQASRLAPGPHILVFSKDGYKQEKRAVETLAGKNVSFSVDLTAVFKVSVSSNPPGAGIWVDGEDSGMVTPAQLTLERRQHDISVRKAGYREASVSANPNSGPTDFSLLLLSLNQSSEQGPSTNFFRRFVGTDAIPEGKGLVHIRTVPEGATIIVDGRVAPRKTNARWPAEPGVYSIDLQMPGYKSVHRNIQVEQGKIKNIDEILEKQ